MKIGIFDSGMGGTTVFAAVKKVLPEAEYLYIADSKNCPYGEKSDEELLNIVTKNVEELKNWGAEIIVIACNTATVKCIDILRERYPEIKFVGTEPAIKLAAETNARDILVLATPGTVQSERAMRLLKENQREGQKITLLACPGLADMVEKTLRFDQDYNLLALTDAEKTVVRQKLAEIFADADMSGNPDIVVLGCTHYSLIKPEIQEFFPSSVLIDGNDGIARQVENVVETNYNIVNE